MATLIAMSFGQASAYAKPADPCTNPDKHILNSWFLATNDGDQSDREDLLASLRLLATGGFSVKHVFAFPEVDTVTFIVNFDPSYRDSSE